MHVVDGKGDLIGLLRDPLAPRGHAKKLAATAGPGESTYTFYDREIAARAQVWLHEKAQQNHDKPWVLFVSFVAPHFPLTAPEQSTARLLVQIGDSRVWERELPIPSPAAEIVEAWEADADYPAGTPVLFHVSNHGNNEYDLIGVEVL